MHGLETVFTIGTVETPKQKTCHFFRKGRHVPTLPISNMLFDNPSSRSGQVALRHPVPRILPFR